MRIVFCGTADFAVPSLHAIAAAHDIAAVVTQPDRAGSRGRPALRPVAAAAERLGIPVQRPARIRDAEAVAAIMDLGPDVLVVAAYGQIIPAALLDGPPLGGVNVHGSLLPHWRGAAPVAAAILHGDESTGVSIMRMDPGLDTGPVYARRATVIGPRETAPELSERLAVEGADLLGEVLRGLTAGGLRAEPQDETAATLAPRLRRDDGAVEWAEVDAQALDRRVRALQPWPGVTVPVGDVRLRLLEGMPAPEADAADAAGAAPGEIVGPHGEALDVATASGIFRVVRVQPPGGRPMSPAAFLRGHRRTATAVRR